jgi:ankyrin repeat protein
MSDPQRSDSPEATFEAAVDAVVNGDIESLRRLLDTRPDLVRQRSSREHHSTLLHYVSANGVEDDRQKTPANIVEVAALLLDRGADVNATSDAYGGDSTTLALVATSVHPEEAGVAEALMELLISRGAILEREPGALIRACLANGRPQAAEFLAKRGARLDFEGAAGVGRRDRVQELLPGAKKDEIERGFVRACAFGKDDVVQLLLDYGADPGADGGTGMTGLHLAAHEGHAETVRLLLAHHAPVEAKNVYGGTVLAQTVWSVIHHPRPEHRAIVEALIAAGAEVGEDWLTGDRDVDDLLARARS